MALDTQALANIVAGGSSAGVQGATGALQSAGDFTAGGLGALQQYITGGAVQGANGALINGSALPGAGGGGGGVAPAAGAAPAGVGGVGDLSVPNGYGYYTPMLQAIVSLLGLNQQGQQFGVSAAQKQAADLAALSAQGGSAAELAYRRAGIGLPAMGSNSDLASLIVNATKGMAPLTNTIGGFGYSLPDTLTGRQTSQLAGDPNTASVVNSFARAAGDPNYLQRSIAALLPGGFKSVGAGVG